MTTVVGRTLRILLLSLSVGTATLPALFAKDKWTRIETNDFLLLGNSSKGRIQEVALRLQQFRETYAKIFPNARVDSPIPIRVLVFKSEKSYRPFKPLYEGKPANLAGYFQAGEDVHYITLTTQVPEVDRYRSIFHEYLHALIHENARQQLVWFSEGLAEFYSTFEVRGKKKVYLGRPIHQHVLLLRRKSLLPLDVFFAVGHGSPHYNEKSKMGILYAQSWAFMHYLLLGNEQERRTQLFHFLDLLAQGKDIESGFQQAFHTDFATVEEELRRYIGQSTLPMQILTFKEKLDYDREFDVSRIPESEAQAYLGDLMRRIQRPEDAEIRLRSALQADPNLSVAHAALGRLRFEEDRIEEACESLALAVAGDKASFFDHYLYAYLLSQEPVSGSGVQEQIPIIYQELKKAIALAPWFTRSYRLLSWISITSDQWIDETVSLIEGVLATATDPELSLSLAQLYLHMEDWSAVRRVALPLTRGESEHRSTAQSILDEARFRQEYDSRAPITQSQPWTDPNASGSLGESRSRDRKDFAPQKPGLRRPPPTPEEQTTEILDPESPDKDRSVKGLLTRIACTPGGVTLYLNVGEETLRFHSANPDSIRFTSYSTAVVQQVKCGPVDPPAWAAVGFEASADDNSTRVPISVSFLRN